MLGFVVLFLLFLSDCANLILHVGPDCSQPCAMLRLPPKTEESKAFRVGGEALKLHPRPNKYSGQDQFVVRYHPKP